MHWPTAYIFLTIVLLILSSSAYRLYTILDPNRPKPKRNGNKDPTHLLIVLGSGGHTAEMIAMLTRAITAPDGNKNDHGTSNSPGDPRPKPLDWRRFTHRTWVVGEEDSISAQRAKEFEELASKQASNSNDKDASSSPTGNYTIRTVPRARRIHQPLYTTPLSSLRTLIACLIILLDPKAGVPDMILINGPATATILVLASLIRRFFDVKGGYSKGKLRVVYVESWARVKKLSLSGILLEGVVERFLVQWPQLLEAKAWWGGRGRREFLGVLV